MACVSSCIPNEIKCHPGVGISGEKRVWQWRKEQISTCESSSTDSHFLSSTIKHLLWILYIFLFQKKKNLKLAFVKMSPCSIRERGLWPWDCLSHFFFFFFSLSSFARNTWSWRFWSAEITGRFSSVLFINIKVDTGRVGGSSTGYVSKYKTVSSNPAKFFFFFKCVNVICRRQNNSQVWNIYPQAWKMNEL